MGRNSASPLLLIAAGLSVAACGASVDEAGAEGEEVSSSSQALTVTSAGALRGMEYFDILAFGEVNGIASTEGTVAAQGNVLLRNAGINKLLPHAQGVVAGGTVTLASSAIAGTVQQGNVWSPVNFPNFRIVADSVIGELATASLGSSSLSGTTLTLTGTSPRNVFELNAAQLDDPSDTLQINLSVPTDSTTVIRVLGTNVVAKTFDVLNADPSKLLWVMPAATNVEVAQINFQGTLLAPNAAVKFYDGDFNGTLIAKSVTSNSPYSGSALPTGAYHHVPFSGSLGLSSVIKGLPVRLRHVSDGQCLYPEGGNGGLVRHWACWNDPAMAFFLDDAGGGSYRLRNQKSSQCNYAQSNTDGATTNHWGCWDDPNMRYFLEPVGTNTYRLRHGTSGKCAYTNGGNGGTTNVWSCWNDPNMVFALDPAL